MEKTKNMEKEKLKTAPTFSPSLMDERITKSLAKDNGKFGIRVNNLGPGYIGTGMVKKSYKNKKEHRLRENHTILGRWGTTEDLVGPCIFLASNASNYITAQDIYVDGGWLSNGLLT